MPACLACRVVFEEVQLIALQAGHASPVKWCLRIALQAGHASPVKWCLNEKVELLCKRRIALQAGHASPVKWCLKEKVLLGKWSAIAMLELQRIRFAGWIRQVVFE